MNASWVEVQEVAAWVAQPIPPTLPSTALTTTLLRMSLRKASYQDDCITSSLNASADPEQYTSVKACARVQGTVTLLALLPGIWHPVRECLQLMARKYSIMMGMHTFGSLTLLPSCLAFDLLLSFACDCFNSVCFV